MTGDRLLFMYAVFQIGNKQYRVVIGQELFIERIEPLIIGSQLEFNQVLLVKHNEYLDIGRPFVKNVKVIAEVIAQGLFKKVEIVKFRRRKHFCKHQGHRQYFTKIKVGKIDI